MIRNSEATSRRSNMIENAQNQVDGSASSQKPTVMITTYSECHSRFRFGRLNKQRQQQHQARYGAPNYELQLAENGVAPDDGAGADKSTLATKSERSTDFFNQLKGSQTRPKHKILLDLSQIKGPTGSIRGHKDVVRKSLEEIKVASSRRLTFNLSSSNLSSLSTFMSLNSGTAGNHQANFRAGLSHGLRSLASLMGVGVSLDSTDEHSANQHSSLINESFRAEYLERLVEDEQNCCVAYTTTLGVIRRTYEDSKQIKSILNLNLIKFQERDIYLNQEYKFQLKIRCNSIVVPALFVDGQFIGGAKEVEAMNENGNLQQSLSKFKLSTAPKDVCLCCGNAKFIACPSCNGSRKSAIHHFKYNSIALRCIKCDKNDGLVQCPRCHCQAGGDEQGDELRDGQSKSEAGGRKQLESIGRPPAPPVDENNNTKGDGENDNSCDLVEKGCDVIQVRV